MARNFLLLLGVLTATLLVVSSAASAATQKTETAADVQSAAVGDQSFYPPRCCRWYYGRCQWWCYPCGYSYYCCGGWYLGRCLRCCPAAGDAAADAGTRN